MQDNKLININKNFILAISALFAFTNAIIFSSVNIIVPTIGKEYVVGATMLGWVVSALILSQAAITFQFGRISDIFGRKKLFLIGSSIAALGLFLDGTANSVMLLICYQAIQGIGIGIATSASMAILTSVYPPKEIGKALGIFMAACYVGSSVGPFLGGVMTQYLGWRSMFFLGAFLMLVVSALIPLKIKGEWADARGEKFDILGSIILAISIILFICALTLLPKLLGIILILLSLASMAVFIQWEKKVFSPLFNVSLFLGNKAFIFSNLATLTNYCTLLSSTFFLSLYLQYIQGFTPSLTGLILLVQPVFMAVFALLSGRLSDRVETQKLAALGLSLICVSLLIYSFLTGSSAVWLLIIGLAIQGTGIGIFTTPNAHIVMSSVEKQHLGLASGMVNMMRTIGVNLGISIAVITFSIYIGDVQITPEYHPAFQTGMRVGFIVLFVIVILGIFAQLAGRKKTSGIVIN